MVLSKGSLFFATAILAVLADQLTKLAAKGKDIVIIKDFFSLSYLENTKAIFGLIGINSIIIILIGVVALAVILYHYKRLPEKRYVIVSTALILGGIIGNLIDRIFLGYVVDFIAFSFWPSFNIADSALTAGVIGLLVYWRKR